MTTKTKSLVIRLKWKGEYDSTVTYSPLDVVIHKNTIYICCASISAVAPDNITSSPYGYTYWLSALPNTCITSLETEDSGFTPCKMLMGGNHLFCVNIRNSKNISQPDFWTEQCAKIY